MKTDRQIQQDVFNELKWEPSVNSASIGVDVRNGVVTLAGWPTFWGAGDRDYHRQNAVSAVRYLTSAKGITDINTIKSAAP
jgi:osmotically-inducible protein OsmY